MLLAFSGDRPRMLLTISVQGQPLSTEDDVALVGECWG